MKYVSPYNDGGDANAGYVDGNPSAGVKGSIPRAAAIEHPLRELVNLITGSGQAPSASDLMQLLRAVRSQALSYVAGGGAGNALTATLTPAPMSYAELRELTIIPAASNSAGAATLAVNGLAALPLKWRGSANLPAGMLLAGVPARIVIDGTSGHIADQGSFSGALNLPQFVTVTGSVVAPSYATGVDLVLTGGGASGGGCQGTTSAMTLGGAGGGAGASIIGHIDIVGGATYSITIGAGGVAVSGANPGNGGGSSSFGTLAVAPGGGGGLRTAPASTAGGSGGGSSGATVPAQCVLIPGGWGGDGQCAAQLLSGYGGPSWWGGGGRAGSPAGIVGSAWGSGGGGAYDPSNTGSSYASGAGKQGICMYQWTW